MSEQLADCLGANKQRISICVDTVTGQTGVDAYLVEGVEVGPKTWEDFYRLPPLFTSSLPVRETDRCQQDEVSMRMKDELTFR